MERHDTLLLACAEPLYRNFFRSVLEEHYNLLEAGNTQQALLLLEQNIGCIAAVILDITTPEKLSIDFFQYQAAAGLLEQVPVIVITADEDPATLNQAFQCGAVDVIPQYYDQYAMLHRIENIVELNLYKQHLAALVEEQAKILHTANDSMVGALSSMIEYRSVESGQHILRIRHFTKILLEELVHYCPEYNLQEDDIRNITSASALHDIGKIAIPDSILMKEGNLTPEEWQIMKGHALTGCKMLESLSDLGNREYLRYAHNICHYHHERWDGSGYPEGLSGDDIPICAQVVGLADVYDALTTKRVYKDAYSFDTAINMILGGECGAFSPKLLECFKHVTEAYEALARAYADGLSPNTESFDTAIAPPASSRNDNSMERTWAKYQALVHYAGAFLMELDMDNSLFHLIYNPYPEFVSFHNINSFADLTHLALETLVVPSQKEQMRHFLYYGIQEFLDEGLRRASHQFLLRSKADPEGMLFDITLLRINPIDSSRRTLAVLCKQIATAAVSPEPDLYVPAEYTYCCKNTPDFPLVFTGKETQDLAGYTPEEICSRFGGQLIQLVVPEDRELVRREIREQLNHSTRVKLEYRITRADGSIRWVLNNSRLIIGSDGQERLYSYLTDITANRSTIDTLNEQLERYEIILAQTENVLFDWDILSDSIAFSNTWEKIFGFAPISSNVRSALTLGSFFHPDDLPLLFDAISNLENGSSYEMVEARIATANGRYIWCRFRASAIRDEAGTLTKVMGIIINIDAEKQAAQALQHQAERDSLTKLLNKESARRYAEEYFLQFSQNLHCALLVIDLDDFKQVNDRYGHLFGDSVLTRVAGEIKRMFRTQDIIARIGGDEFMVLMRGISDRTLIEKRCSQLLSVLQKAFQTHQYQLPLNCSIGIALGPEHGNSYVELFQRADVALYQAKRTGKQGYVFYSPTAPTALDPLHPMTAISQHIDSDEQPGLSNTNIVQYAFQRLYSSDDITASINGILGMIGQQMNVSRVYIFENSFDNRLCHNTFEWCNHGIQPEIRNLQNISYETDIPGYENNFNEQGIFYCPDISILPKAAYDIVEAQGIKSMLQCAIRENGVFRGYIGFDECVTQRFWTKEQIQTLSYFSDMLSVFLLKEQEKKRTQQRAAELGSILDQQNARIYIIDPRTYELKYLNEKAKAMAPGCRTGCQCYKALHEKTAPCPGCPVGKAVPSVLQDPEQGLRVLIDVSPIKWDGEDACLVTIRQIPDNS